MVVPAIMTELARAVLGGDELAAHALYDCIAEQGPEFWEQERPHGVLMVGDVVFSTRVRNAVETALATADLENTPMTRLTELTEDDLLDQRNFGTISLGEVREKLARLGLRLRNSLRISSPGR